MESEISPWHHFISGRVFHFVSSFWHLQKHLLQIKAAGIIIHLFKYAGRKCGGVFYFSSLQKASISFFLLWRIFHPFRAAVFAYLFCQIHYPEQGSWPITERRSFFQHADHWQ